MSEHKPACVGVNVKLILQAALETSPSQNISLLATGLKKNTENDVHVIDRHMKYICRAG